VSLSVFRPHPKKIIEAKLIATNQKEKQKTKTGY
jgi:hypothetical protein